MRTLVNFTSRLFKVGANANEAMHMLNVSRVSTVWPRTFVYFPPLLSGSAAIAPVYGSIYTHSNCSPVRKELY